MSTAGKFSSNWFVISILFYIIFMPIAGLLLLLIIGLFSNFLPLSNLKSVNVVLSALRTKPDANRRDLSSLQRTAK